LAATQREFARSGFNGAGIERIAAEAQCNRALVYFYFKNKGVPFEGSSRRGGRFPACFLKIASVSLAVADEKQLQEEWKTCLKIIADLHAPPSPQR